MATKGRAKLIELDDWDEGCLRLRGWIATAFIALITGGLMALYELQLQNVEDIDFRDMLFDHRVTAAGNRYYHKHFVNAEYCCRYDASGQALPCDEGPLQQYYGGAEAKPQCPPTISYTCSSLQSIACLQLHSSLMTAAGLDASTGAVDDCYAAGRIRLRAQEDQPAQQLLLEVPGTPLQQLLSNNPATWPPGAVGSFVAAAKQSASNTTLLPSKPLSQLLTVAGSAVVLAPQWAEPLAPVHFFGWPWELWPWSPNNSPCPDTETPARMHLAGSVKVPLPDSSSQEPLLVAGSFAGDTFHVPAYKVLNSSSSNGTVAVMGLSRLQVPVGYMPFLDSCSAWLMDEQGLRAEYSTQVWSGPAAELEAAAYGAAEQEVAVVVVDVSEPQVLALPHYRGEIYVYLAIVAGGIFVLTMAPVLLISCIISVNIRRSKGLPTIFYRYMRRYRGW